MTADEFNALLAQLGWSRASIHALKRSGNSDLLLWQSFLRCFQSWSIDNGLRRIGA